MPDLIARLREWLAPSEERDAERERVDRKLREQRDRLRLLRIDAGIPERRHYSAPSHPGRRGSDA